MERGGKTEFGGTGREIGSRAGFPSTERFWTRTAMVRRRLDWCISGRGPKGREGGGGGRGGGWVNGFEITVWVYREGQGLKEGKHAALK